MADREDFGRNIGFLVNDISRMITTEYNRIMKPMGLTRSQWRVVVYLFRDDGLTQSELADLLGVGKVTVGGLIERLEQAGWVTRQSDPQDRRTRRVYLTDKGRAIEEEMLDKGSLLTRYTLHRLSKDEQNNLIDLLGAVKQELDTLSEYDQDEDRAKLIEDALKD